MLTGFGTSSSYYLGATDYDATGQDEGTPVGAYGDQLVQKYAYDQATSWLISGVTDVQTPGAPKIPPATPTTRPVTEACHADVTAKLAEIQETSRSSISPRPALTAGLPACARSAATAGDDVHHGDHLAAADRPRRDRPAGRRHAPRHCRRPNRRGRALGPGVPAHRGGAAPVGAANTRECRDHDGTDDHRDQRGTGESRSARPKRPETFRSWRLRPRLFLAVVVARPDQGPGVIGPGDAQARRLKVTARHT